MQYRGGGKTVQLENGGGLGGRWPVLWHKLCTPSPEFWHRLPQIVARSPDRVTLGVTRCLIERSIVIRRGRETRAERQPVLNGGRPC